MVDDKSWHLEVRKEIEVFLVRLGEMMDQIRGRKDDVSMVKHESEKMNVETEIEEEVKAVEEIQVDAQASRVTYTKVVVVKDSIQLKEPTRFEEYGKLLAQLGDVNSDSLEQQIVVDQTHNHEVNVKTLNVVDCERLE